MSAEPQCARAVLMIRPARFGSNPQTAESNAFQQLTDFGRSARVQAIAAEEFDGLAAALREAGVRVHVFEDTDEPLKPDAVFPNNWVTTHPDGTVVLYPMMAPNRRLERRLDLIEALVEREGYHVHRTIELTAHEAEGRFLEGSGSLVLDRANRMAYACLSPRTSIDLLGEFGQRLDYEVVAFDAVDIDGTPIYHTNVMLCIGEGFAVICAAAIVDAAKRHAVLETLRTTGHEIVEISHAQMAQFAGNMLELDAGDRGRVLAMSQRAERCLTPEQRAVLTRHARIVSAPIETIEDSAGGSVRCMLAEVFLPRAGGRGG